MGSYTFSALVTGLGFVINTAPISIAPRIICGRYILSLNPNNHGETKSSTPEAKSRVRCALNGIIRTMEYS